MFSMQPRVSSVKTAWLSSEVLSFLCDEAANKSPQETGGVLLGYWSENPGVPVITNAVGPGPRAVHQERRFVPDYDFQDKEIERLYLESGRRLEYLGDWHSHPGEAGYLSKKDRTTLARIAVASEKSNGRAIMLILAYGPKWEVALWAAQKIRRSPCWARFEIEQMSVRSFQSNPSPATSSIS